MPEEIRKIVRFLFTTPPGGVIVCLGLALLFLSWQIAVFSGNPHSPLVIVPGLKSSHEEKFRVETPPPAAQSDSLSALQSAVQDDSLRLKPEAAASKPKPAAEPEMTVPLFRQSATEEAPALPQEPSAAAPGYLLSADTQATVAVSTDVAAATAAPAAVQPPAVPELAAPATAAVSSSSIPRPWRPVAAVLLPVLLMVFGKKLSAGKRRHLGEVMLRGAFVFSLGAAVSGLYMIAGGRWLAGLFALCAGAALVRISFRQMVSNCGFFPEISP